MSTYELDDELVRTWLNGTGSAGTAELALALGNQLSLPVPTKIGAVVRTDTGIAVLADLDSQPGNARWILNYQDTEGELQHTWADGMSIGRITEVLSPGVGL